MWPFGKNKVVSAPTPETNSPAVPTADEIKRQAVREAISALGRQAPGRGHDRRLPRPRDGNPTPPALTTYRKGEQLTKEEKKAIGLRSNANRGYGADVDFLARWND